MLHFFPVQEEDALISAHVNLLENTMDLMHEVSLTRTFRKLRELESF